MARCLPFSLPGRSGSAVDGRHQCRTVVGRAFVFSVSATRECGPHRTTGISYNKDATEVGLAD